ncbi:LCP family protein [Streptomyces sp. NPDC051567]|uniref:LCP family protein n=1 Tax=Streptomyces sp. NPDC051567 TaxID=3365660 RepID=UPI0037884523
MRQSSVRGEGSPVQDAGGIPGGPDASGAVPPPRDGSGPGRRPSGGPPKRQGRRRVLRWVACVLSLLILATAAAGYLYYRHLDGNLRSGQRLSGRSDVPRTEVNAAGQRPLNILMIGSDSRDKPENLELGGSRDSVGAAPLADVQMLLHVSADRKNASVISIPRDTRVDVPECKDPLTGEKFKATNTVINQTLGRGGPGCTLATWEKLTNVYIDHWMTVDFSGVVHMADAIGGVEVCVKDNVWDRPLPLVSGGSGLKLQAGKSKVKGEQALQWLRTRHAFSSDLGRAQAQHMYMNSMIRELKGQNAFTDVARLTGLAEAATRALVVSEEIGTVKKLYDLALQLKDVPVNRITMTTMPTLPDPQNPKNWLVADREDAAQLWTMVRKDVPFDKNGAPAAPEGQQPGAQPSQQPGGQPGQTPSKPPVTSPDKVAVHVVNGTGAGTGASKAPAPRRPAEVVGQLVAKGFTSAKAETAPTPEKTTVVRYATPEQEADAQSVAAALGIPASSVQRSAGVHRITLVIGADWREAGPYPQQPAPEAGALPETAGALNGSDSEACMDVYKPYRW